MTDRSSLLDAYSNFVSQLTPSSAVFHQQLVPRPYLIHVLDDLQSEGQKLDVLKKALFYGKDVESLVDQRNAWDKEKYYGINTDVTPINVIHAILGIITEASELAELLMDSILSGKPIDHTKLVLEGGDILWYTQLLARETGEGLEGFIAKNVEKLSKRFPNAVFTEEAAIARVDVE